MYGCGYTQIFGHLNTYCRGLLSDLKRKSAEPIALAAGCAVRTLQEFLRDHPWHHSQVREQLQRDVGVELARLPDGGLGNVGLSWSEWRDDLALLSMQQGAEAGNVGLIGSEWRDGGLPHQGLTASRSCGE